MDIDDLKPEDSQQKPQSDESDATNERRKLSPTTFRRVLSDEEFRAASDRIAEGMIKSLHEAEPD